ncbi:uncharacterized protein N7459_004689 [Penicillium hispanicum]|uniref:uncharacterized protein n=1 Tax=Penicillium hispanicum TaxID=1080232 RepID=UPI0025415022|nr:uncharacterized protein N7459_004689 [Penicillium hispanicum]KAJ5584889.1 hypothetical protein N7459_004689 [Penicillium hispanicum]
MADADEDAVHAKSGESSQVEADLTDETQDFRLLNHLSFLTDTSSTTLPRRGEKDFEPNPTEFQADVLSASRQAMHNALAHPRLHNPKNKVTGIYAPDGPVLVLQPNSADAARSTSQSEGGKPVGKGLGISLNACVYVPNPKGQYFKTMGQADRLNRIWLLPEEALYLLERGSLDIRWPSSSTGPVEGNEDSDSDNDTLIPMSLQAAYACFIGRGGLTLERYSVFTGLRRLGYTVMRAPGWDDDALPSEASEANHVDAYVSPQRRGAGLSGILGSLFNWIHDPKSTASTAAGPVVGCGIHRNYVDVYRRLATIPWYDPVRVAQRDSLDPAAPFRTVLHVYKPTTAVKKTAPPTPEFRIAVVNTREQTTMPTLTQLGALLESTPLDPPRGDKMERQLYTRLRHGYRNVILAVVDQGVISYLRVSDAAFGKEKLYEPKNAPTGFKRGGSFKQRKR